MSPIRMMPAAVLMVLSLTGCAATLHATPTPSADSADLLSQLVVAEEDTGAHYDREEWHIGWAEQGGGCDTRDVVLIEQGDGETRDSGCRLTCPARDCWTSPYDDTRHSVARELDIDHRVALGEAARSRVVQKGGQPGYGAGRVWTAEQRHLFAEDLSNLVAVTSSVNRSKGDRDAGVWRPSARSGWCGYARDYAATKVTYALTVDQREYDGLAAMLATCP